MTGEELKKLIQKSQKEIDAKIRLIDDLMSADISGNNYVKLQAAKKDLTAFRSKVSNEKEWREADYQEKKNGASYLLKSGGIGGYTPESYVKKVVEAIDYKNEKSPYKPIVEKYNQNVAYESTKGNMPVLNETALGLKEKVPQSNTPVTRKANTALTGAGSGMSGGEETKKIPIPEGYKAGDKLAVDVGGKKIIYTAKEGTEGGLSWITNNKGEKSYTHNEFENFIKQGKTSPIKEYKYQGKDYRLNPNDNKWYESGYDKQPASAQVVERLNELSKASGDMPKKEGEKTVAAETRSQADNKTINRDTPPEGAKVKHSTGTYVYTGGKWRHKSGDGYDFEANASNVKELEAKIANGDYEVWDNKAGGYVKGAPVARTAESIKAGGEFRLGLNKKTPLVDNGEGSPDLAEQMPKGGLVPPAAKQIASKKAAGDGITPREQLPTTGITTGSTIKDALGKLGGGGDTPLAKQSELYDPESYLAVKAGKKGLDLGKFGGVTDYLPDVFKAAMGLAGANEKLPEFKTPQYFTDYENKLREQSTQGLTDAEYAQSMRSADRGYAYDVNNISNFAGGRPGVALANLGRAANTLQDAYGNINVADAQIQRQNLQQYGGAVGTHLQLDQNNFNQKFNIAAQNKMAGAQLAADAFSNISNRYDFNEAYGKGSTYAKYQESLLQGQEYQNSILDYILKNPSALPEYNPNIMNQNTSIPNYQNYYLPNPTQTPNQNGG